LEDDGHACLPLRRETLRVMATNYQAHFEAKNSFRSRAFSRGRNSTLSKKRQDTRQIAIHPRDDYTLERRGYIYILYK
jgi:hypothetical protein